MKGDPHQVKVVIIVIAFILNFTASCPSAKLVVNLTPTASPSLPAAGHIHAIRILTVTRIMFQKLFGLVKVKASLSLLVIFMQSATLRGTF